MAQELVGGPENRTETLTSTSAAYEEGHYDVVDGLSESDLALDQEEPADIQLSGPEAAAGLLSQASVAESMAEAESTAAEGLQEEVPGMSASEAVLARAEAEERALATGKGIKGLANEEAVPTDPLDSLRYANKRWCQRPRRDDVYGSELGCLLVHADRHQCGTIPVML